ncbi:MAG TPA: hypothetical protein VH640_05195 [Bryobacteraceae bacterium]|jgi:hypothetical protein
MRLAILFAAVLPLAAQTPAKPPLTKAPGDPVTLTIFANSLPDRAPLGLQWEVVYPAQLMDPEGKPEAGSAAVDSGKSLECKPRKEYSFACVLSGGSKPISDGQIAVFHFRIHPDAMPGKVTLRIQSASARQKDNSDAALRNTESVFIIR